MFGIKEGTLLTSITATTADDRPRLYQVTHVGGSDGEIVRIELKPLTAWPEEQRQQTAERWMEQARASSPASVHGEPAGAQGS